MDSEYKIRINGIKTAKIVLSIWLLIGLLFSTLYYPKKIFTMKKLKSLLYVIVAILFVGLSSCGSDGPGSMNQGQAQAAFSSVNENLAASLDELANAPGAEALNSFAGVAGSIAPFGKVSYRHKEIREQAKLSLTTLRSMVHFGANGVPQQEGPFIFDDHKGKYYWNPNTETFDMDGESTVIQMYYPTEGSETNNAEFKLSGYTETLVGDEYNPTFIDATVLVDGDIQAELDLEASYNNETYEPEFIDLSISLTPFTWSVKLDDRPSTTTSVSESLSKSGTALIGVGLKVTYNNGDKSEENINKISGYVQLMRIKFVASLEVANLQSPDDFSIAIKIDGKDAGDVVLEGENMEPVIKYNNGETDSLEEVFADLAAQLEGLLGNEPA
jgi:hypothetical protein